MSKESLLADANKTPEQLLDELLAIVELEKLEEDLYRGISRDFVGKRVFGGQVLAQALMAASQSADRPCHSIHAYFLRGGDIRAPIVYQVKRLRDGRSILAREVDAIQHGHIIFSAIASFAAVEEGLDFQTDMPEAPAPDDLKNEAELLAAVEQFIPKSIRARVMRKRHVEIKPTVVRNPFSPQPEAPHQAVWLRVADAAKKVPKDIKVQQALMAFYSDFMLLGTSLMPHGLSFWSTSNLQAATIDHSIHFHRAFDVTDWVLHDMHCHTTSRTHSLNRGTLWQGGKLVASTQQEGLIRLRDDPQF